MSTHLSNNCFIYAPPNSYITKSLLSKTKVTFITHEGTLTGTIELMEPISDDHSLFRIILLCEENKKYEGEWEEKNGDGYLNLVK